ncbi:MAG TPA: YtxH domain-containing protein [Bacteroidota bacterium]|nr:YtxH domain-containing protein [Bacteroidota bacterium]
MNSGKVIIGTLAGVTAGTILGMLFAPEKGSVTRKNISQKGIEMADAMKEKVNEYADTVNEKLDTLRDKAVEWLERDKEMMEGTPGEANQGTNI